jgi:inner membrane protein
MGLKAALISIMVLLFLIPLNMIEGLIWEREGRKQTAEADISGAWGGPAALGGPVLVVPRIVREKVLDQEGKLLHVLENRENVYLLPRRLVLDCRSLSETKSRGIFHIPVFTMGLEGSGEFALAPLYKNERPEDLIWEEARLQFSYHGLKGISDAGALFWDGERIDFEPGSGAPSFYSAALSAPVDIGSGERSDIGRTLSFRFSQEIRGGLSMDFLPLAQLTTVRLDSDWSAPSFRGYYLPGKKDLREDGFTAEWEVHALSRDVPESWCDSDEEVFYAMRESAFGLNLFPPFDSYQKTRRTVDYGILFLIIPFLTFLMFELIGRVRIHPVQYLLAGCGNILFYLLLLSLSEHTGFALSYLAAASAVTVMLTLYALSFRGMGRKVLILPAVLSAGYGYLFFVLKSEDYALLMGSAGLFLALGATMFLTRKVSWYGERETGKEGISD